MDLLNFKRSNISIRQKVSAYSNIKVMALCVPSKRLIQQDGICMLQLSDKSSIHRVVTKITMFVDMEEILHIGSRFMCDTGSRGISMVASISSIRNATCACHNTLLNIESRFSCSLALLRCATQCTCSTNGWRREGVRKTRKISYQ